MMHQCHQCKDLSNNFESAYDIDNCRRILTHTDLDQASHTLPDKEHHHTLPQVGQEVLCNVQGRCPEGCRYPAHISAWQDNSTRMLIAHRVKHLQAQKHHINNTCHRHTCTTQYAPNVRTAVASALTVCLVASQCTLGWHRRFRRTNLAST